MNLSWLLGTTLIYIVYICIYIYIYVCMYLYVCCAHLTELCHLHACASVASVEYTTQLHALLACKALPLCMLNTWATHNKLTLKALSCLLGVLWTVPYAYIYLAWAAFNPQSASFLFYSSFTDVHIHIDNNSTLSYKKIILCVSSSLSQMMQAHELLHHPNHPEYQVL